MALNYHLLFKIVLVGDPEVGKSATLKRCANDSLFPSTFGVHFLKRKVEMDGKRIKLQIWNVAGQESSQALTTSYYHGTQGFILAYDVTDRTSYENIPEWLSIIETHASEQDFQKMLVANKCRCNERNRVIAKKEGEEFAREYGMRYAELNDLESSEIDRVLKMLIQDILHNAGSQERAEGTGACNFDVGEVGNKLEGEKEFLLA